MVVGMAQELTVIFLSLVDDLALVLSGGLDDSLLFSSGFGAFTHPVRQKVLVLLADDGSLTRAELAEKLVRDEDVSYERVERMEVALHHNHLPKLEDYQYIEYDARNGDVVLWEDPETVRGLLDSKRPDA